jgi:hypothetical protein
MLFLANGDRSTVTVAFERSEAAYRAIQSRHVHPSYTHLPQVSLNLHVLLHMDV